MASQLKSPPDFITGCLIVIIGGLVVIHIIVVGIFGVKPPKFEIRDQQTSTQNIAQPRQNTLSYARQKELEALLLPPPILPSSALLWSDEVGISNPHDAENFANIKPFYLATLPDLTGLSTHQRKARFVEFIVPLILRANVELLERRELIAAAARDNNLASLLQWAELYDYTPASADIKAIELELLKRVNIIPPAIAIAQGAIESGWGTSRFATQGNALFGQWAWKKDAGLRPNEARRNDSVVRSFETLFDSVRAYMHNINTHNAYEDFRNVRADIGAKIKTEKNTIAMVKTLLNYSEERGDYIAKLLAMIDHNNFMAYNNARLADES